MPIRHSVRAGECIASIAFRYGFVPETLWDHEQNAALRERREDPNVLVPGDVVFVPDKRARVEACSTDQRHRFRRLAVPEKLEVQLLREGEPRAGEVYTLEVDGSIVQRGRTDAEGRVRAPIAPDARSARLLLSDETEVIELTLGHLLPVDDLRGAQQRLQSLGLYRGECHGTLDEDTAAALVELQLMQELEPTGELDTPTQDALRALWGDR